MRDKEQLCRRHSAKLIWVAFGTLLDFSGKLYPRQAQKILDQTRTCPNCYRGAR